MASIVVSGPEKESCVDLVRAGVLAPSPDNNQPWMFRAADGALTLHLDRSQSLPSDVHGMYDLMSVGAVMENIVIAARQQQRRTDIQYPDFGDSLTLEGDSPLIATLRFQPGAEADPLFQSLESRCTNRKLYAKRPIGQEVLEGISQEVSGVGEVQFDWITERETINEFAGVMRKSDRFRFEYEPFHGEIFRQLRFTAAAAESTRDGLDVRTMELPPGGAMMLRALQSWRRMWWINRLGLGRLLTVPSWLSVRRSGALGVLSIPHPSIRLFVESGRALQRIWLGLDAQGLGMCPLGSLPIFLAHMEQLQGEKLHAAHQRLSQQLNDRFRQLVPQTAGRTLMMLFRTGYAQPPKVRSLRRLVR